jgi:hypothetical protein
MVHWIPWGVLLARLIPVPVIGMWIGLATGEAIITLLFSPLSE